MKHDVSEETWTKLGIKVDPVANVVDLDIDYRNGTFPDQPVYMYTSGNIPLIWGESDEFALSETEGTKANVWALTDLPDERLVQTYITTLCLN